LVISADCLECHPIRSLRRERPYFSDINED
jgi:hypothetical protein